MDRRSNKVLLPKQLYFNTFAPLLQDGGEKMSKKMKMELINDTEIREILLNELKGIILNKIIFMFIIVAIIVLALLVTACTKDITMLVFLTPVIIYYITHKEDLRWQ